jgi:hypothetical protein
MNHFKKPLPPKGRDAQVSVPVAVPVEPERPAPPKPAMTAVADYIAQNGHKEMPRATAVRPLQDQDGRTVKQRSPDCTHRRLWLTR